MEFKLPWRGWSTKTISMINWVWTSRLSIKKSLSGTPPQAASSANHKKGGADVPTSTTSGSRLAIPATLEEVRGPPPSPWLARGVAHPDSMKPC